MAATTYDLLDYAPKANVFFFHSRNPNVAKIYGVRRAPSQAGGYVWVFGCTYPDGYLALKDFVNVIGGKATTRARQKIDYLKSVPDLIAEAGTIASLNLAFKRAPYAHQLEVAEAMLHYARLAVLLEQGMGKTFCVHVFLEALKQLEQRDLRTIVLAPVIVLRNWERETAAFSSFKPFLYKGTAEQRLRLREQLRDENDWGVLITNYETLVPPSQDYTKAGLVNWWLSMPETRREQLVAYWQRHGMAPDGMSGLVATQYRTVKGETRVLKKYEDTVYQALKKIPASNLLSPELMRAQRELDDLAFLKELPCDVLILDEGSRIKGHKSKRSHATMSLAAPIPRRYVLSGTLCLGDPRDVYMPMTLVNEQIFGTNYYRFEKQYAVYAPYNKHVVLEWRNLDQLKLRMDPYVIAKKREDCLDLPARIFTQRYYELSDQQLSLYNAIVEQDTVEVAGREMDVSLSVIKINKCLQVLSGHVILPFPRNDAKCNACEHVVACVENDIYPWQARHCVKHDPAHPVPKPKREYHTLPNPKADLLAEDLALSEGKTIVWAYYQYDLEQIRNVLHKRNIPFITADEPDCDARFEADDACRVFLGQVSQGIGITLNSATTTIYYSHGLGLEPRLQSLDRNLRIGQTRKVLVKDYMCPKSIEETVVRLLRHKEDVKNFIQSKPQCPLCEGFEYCFERDIVPYSEKCLLNEEKVQAETRRTIRLRTLQPVND